MRNWFRGLKLNQKFTVTTLIFIFLLFLSIIFLKKLLFKEKTGKISKVTEPKRKLGDEKCETGFAD